MALLSGHNLSCIKRDRTLFENLNLVFEHSQLIHLKGKNGAGKTSLMRILAGLSQPNDGAMHFNDVPIQECFQDYQAGLLFIGHRLGCNEALSAVENLLFWSNQQGLQWGRDQILDVLFELGLVGLEDIPLGMLSAGQQRRTALARMWLKPQACIWLLDEPFTALDVSGVDLIESKIHAFVDHGGCVVATSHQALTPHLRLRDIELEYQF